MDTSDSEGTVADSEGDIDDNNLYARRLMCADSFSLSPRLMVSYCVKECSPVIKQLPCRKLTEVEKTALISRKVHVSASTYVSSSEEVLACGDEGSGDPQQAEGCAAVNCEGLNKGARNGWKGKAESEELHSLALGKPVRRVRGAPITPGARRRRRDIRVGAAAARPGPHISEPSSGTLRPRRPLPSPHVHAVSRDEPGRGGGTGGSATPCGGVPSAPTRGKQREGELGHKAESEPKPDTNHAIQTRSGCCTSQPAVAEDSTRQDKISCQSPRQPMELRKTEQRPACTPTAANCEGLNKGARNEWKGKAETEELHSLALGKPVRRVRGAPITWGARRRRRDIRVGAAAAWPCPRVSEPSSGTPHPRRPLPSPHVPAVSRDEPGRGGGTGGSATLRGLGGKEESRREVTAQTGCTRPEPSLHSRSFSEKESSSGVPSAPTHVKQREGESEPKPDTNHAIQTRSGCCTSQPAVAEDSTRQDKISCQSPRQPMGLRKTEQRPACTPTAANCEGLNKGARNEWKGKAETEELHSLALGKPVRRVRGAPITWGARRRRRDIRVGAAAAWPCPRVSEPSSGTPHPRRPLPSPHVPAVSRDEPGRGGGTGGSVTLRGLGGKEESRRDVTAQTGCTRPEPSLHSRSFSEKESSSGVPSAPTHVKQREGESEPKPNTNHAIQTRSGCCASQPAVAEDSTRQDKISCQSLRQPMGLRKTEPRPACTPTASESARQSGAGDPRRTGPEDRQRPRRFRPLSGNMECDAKRKRKAAPESELSVSGSCSKNQRKQKCGINGGPQAESEKCSKTPNNKKGAAWKSRGGKSLNLCIINRRNLAGETLLHRAVMDGDVELVRAILRMPVDVNATDYAGWTPLHEAAVRGCPEIVVALLEAGAVINCVGDGGSTPLHDTVSLGHHQVAQLLLDCGADPSLKNERGESALSMTVDSSLREMIERYLPRTGRISVPAQRRSNCNPTQEGGHRQQVKSMMQNKKVGGSAAKSSHWSAEAVRTRKRTTGQETMSQSPVAQRMMIQSPVTQRAMIQSPVAQRMMIQSPVTQRAIIQSPVAQRMMIQSPVAQRAMIQSPVAQKTRSQSSGPQRTVSQSPVAQRTVSQSPVAQKTRSQSPVAQRTVSQSPVAQRTVSQSPVAHITRGMIGASNGGNESNIDSLALSSMLCVGGSREISAELQDEYGSEHFRAAEHRSEPPRPAKSDDRKTGSACHCSQQDVHTDADVGNSCFSLSKIKCGFLDCDLGKKMPESNVIPCLDETGGQYSVENTLERLGDIHYSRSPDLVDSMEAENKTSTKGPQTVGCEPELLDNTMSQSILPALPVGGKPTSKGTTLRQILGISGEPVILGNTNDFIQVVSDIPRDNRRASSGECTEEIERCVLSLKAPEVLRDSHFSAQSGESGIVHHSPVGCGMEENSEEFSISLLAPHSKALRRRVVEHCLPNEGERLEETLSGASVVEPTLALESDCSTPSLLFEDLNDSEGLSPCGQHVGGDGRLHVVSSVNETHYHSTSSRDIDPEDMTPSSNISMQREPTDSHVVDCSLACSTEEDRRNLLILKSRTVTKPVLLTGASSHAQELSDSHDRGNERQKKTVQNHIVEKHLHAVEHLSGSTEFNGNTHLTLSSENANRIRGRLQEEECSLPPCSQADLSRNGVQGKEMEVDVDSIHEIAPERPGLLCGEQLLKGTLPCYSASVTFSCSESQVTSTIQEMENTLITECYMQKIESRNGKERVLPKCNPKDMELAHGLGGSFDLAVNDATVKEDVVQAEDGKTNSSYDSDCTMISESDYVECNSFCTALENACLHPELTVDSTKGQLKENGKRSFENAFGTSIENTIGKCKGNVTFTCSEDSGHKISNVGNDAVVEHQNEDYILRNFSGQQSEKYEIIRTENSNKKAKEIQQMRKQNVSSKKHPGGSKAPCIACAATTSCRGLQQTLKLPVRKINKRNSRGETNLHLAAKRGDLATVRALIEAGINVNQADYAGWTALHEASALGHSAVAEELLLSGADVNSRGLEGLTPLHDAVMSNHYEIVKLLLQYGSNPNDQNVFGKSPLDLECEECIKELLSMFHGPFLSPREGFSKNSSVIEKKMASSPSLDCESDCSGSGIQPSKESHVCSGGSTLESTITTLESLEKKQREMSSWKCASPEDIGTFSEAFSQIQEVLNSVLNQHKVEHRELTRKYRMASDSFKQGFLREQLKSLASRHKCLLRMLQKQNALKLSVEAQSCRLPAGQPLIQYHKPGAGTLWGINGGPYRRTAEQDAPLSCHGGVAEEAPSLPSVSGPGDAGVLHDSSDSTDIISDVESVEPEAEVDGLGDAEIVMPCADNAIRLETRTSEIGPGQSKLSGHQSFLPSASQPAVGSRGDEQHSEITGEKGMDCSSQMSFLEVSNNNASISSSSFTNELHISETHPTRPNVTSVPSSSFLHQTLSTPSQQQNALDVNEMLHTKKCARTADHLQGVFPYKVQVRAHGQQNSSETNSMRGRNSANGYPVPDSTSSGAALSPKVQKSACEASVHKTLQQHGDTAVRNRQLVDLIQCGAIESGDQALQLTLKGHTYSASLLPDGSIKDTNDRLFLNPEDWIVSLLGHDIPVTSEFAWKKVTYRSKSLMMYAENSDLPVKNSVATQTFFPAFTPAMTHHTEEAVNTSVCDFMKINRILLISDDEFIPNHLMDHYWDMFIKSEDWEI